MMIMMRFIFGGLHPRATSFFVQPWSFKANSLFFSAGLVSVITRNHPDHQIFFQTIWIVSEPSAHCDISFT